MKTFWELLFNKSDNFGYLFALPSSLLTGVIVNLWLAHGLWRTRGITPNKSSRRRRCGGTVSTNRSLKSRRVLTKQSFLYLFTVCVLNVWLSILPMILVVGRYNVVTGHTIPKAVIVRVQRSEAEEKCRTSNSFLVAVQLFFIVKPALVKLSLLLKIVYFYEHYNLLTRPLLLVTRGAGGVVGTTNIGQLGQRRKRISFKRAMVGGLILALVTLHYSNYKLFWNAPYYKTFPDIDSTTSEILSKTAPVVWLPITSGHKVWEGLDSNGTGDGIKCLVTLHHRFPPYYIPYYIWREILFVSISSILLITILANVTIFVGFLRKRGNTIRSQKSTVGTCPLRISQNQNNITRGRLGREGDVKHKDRGGACINSISHPHLGTAAVKGPKVENKDKHLAMALRKAFILLLLIVSSLSLILPFQIFKIRYILWFKGCSENCSPYDYAPSWVLVVESLNYTWFLFVYILVDSNMKKLVFGKA